MSSHVTVKQVTDRQTDWHDRHVKPFNKEHLTTVLLHEVCSILIYRAGMLKCGMWHEIWPVGMLSAVRETFQSKL
jgi:thiamine phosphate synthase YjbQ (UPF0047 family)